MYTYGWHLSKVVLCLLDKPTLGGGGGGPPAETLDSLTAISGDMSHFLIHRLAKRDS
jgi:hypothetical protein